MKQKIILLLFFSIILTLVNSNHIFAEITTKEESEKKTSLIEEQDQDIITEDDNIILDKNGPGAGFGAEPRAGQTPLRGPPWQAPHRGAGPTPRGERGPTPPPGARGDARRRAA